MNERNLFIAVILMTISIFATLSSQYELVVIFVGIILYMVICCVVFATFMLAAIVINKIFLYFLKKINKFKKK